MGKSASLSTCFLRKLHNCKLRTLLFDDLCGFVCLFFFVLKTEVLDVDTRKAGTLIALAYVLIYKQDWAWP